MNQGSPKASTGGALPDTPPDSCPDDGTPPLEEPLVTVSGSLPEFDVEALKVGILGCFPSFPQRPKGPAPWSSFRIDPMNRFPSAPRTLSEPHLWPPRPSCINTIKDLSHNMKATILPEIQLPVDCFRVFSDGTLFIEKGFGKDIIKNRLAGRYNKSKLSFGEHVQRVKKVLTIGGREKKEPKRYTVKAKMEEEKLQKALSRWEEPESIKRPTLPVVNCPRRTWAYYNDRRVYLDHVHYVELHIPESVVDSDDVEWSDEGIMIRTTTGRRILENATLFVPENDTLLKDFCTLTAMTSNNGEEDFPESESTIGAVDIVKYHLSHGRWMWIYQTNRLLDPDINIALTEDYEIARYYHVSKGGPYLLKKLCDGIPLTRNDRIFLHRFDIERIQCTPLLTYANILSKMEEKQYEPELTDVRIAIPATAKINCTQESRITQTMKGEPISEPLPPVNLEPVPGAKKETPPGSPKESPEESSKRLSQLFSGATAPTLPASPPESPKISRPSSIFIRKPSKRSLNESQETLKASRSSSILTQMPSKRSSKSSQETPRVSRSSSILSRIPSKRYLNVSQEPIKVSRSISIITRKPSSKSSQETLKASDKSSKQPEYSEPSNTSKPSESSKPSNSSKHAKSSNPSKSSPTYRAKRRLKKYKRKLNRVFSLVSPPIDHKGKGRELPDPTPRTKKNPVPKYEEASSPHTPIHLLYAIPYKTSSPAQSVHDSEKTQSPKETGYEPCPACTQRASGSEHKGNCWRPFVMRVEWSRYPDWNAMERRREEEEISRRLSSVRLRVAVEKEVFVRVRGASFSVRGGGGRGGRVGGRRYSVPELEGRRFESEFKGESVTTISCELPKAESRTGSTRRPRFPGFSLSKSFSKSRPNREAVTTKKQTLTAKLSSPRAAPPTPQVSQLNTIPTPSTATAAPTQIPKPASKDSEQTIANNSAGTTPSLTRLPSSSSSMDFYEEGLVGAKKVTLNSLEDLGILVEGSGLD